MKNQNHLWHPNTQMSEWTKFPKIDRGEGMWLIDENGNRLLDGVASMWCNVWGHSKKELVNAIIKQTKKLQHAPLFNLTNEPSELLAKKLIKLSPNMTQVFFSDNGSTAVEVSLKIAWQYWHNLGKKRKYFLTFKGDYHGDTFGSMSVGFSSGFFDPFKDLLFQVKEITFPYTWDGDSSVHRKETESLRQLENILSNFGSDIAAFICEPIVQGSSGMRVCRTSFMKKVVQKLKKKNIPVIFDEVMTGFGRTGSMFAYQKIGINPDIICLSKGLTGGVLPLGLTICSKKISRIFESKDAKKMLPHGHSYTANPISCAAAVASLDLFKSKKVFEKIQIIEGIHKERMGELASLKCVHRTRVIGLIAAFEITGKSKSYGSKFSRKLKDNFLKHGLVIRPLGNVIYLMPPYCIKKKNLHRSYDIIIALLSNC